MSAFAALVLGADRDEPIPGRLNQALSEAGADVQLRPGEDLASGWAPALAVLVDPLRLTDPADLVVAVPWLLAAEPAAGECVVLTRAVTDTLKLVDDEGRVLGTADRDHHRALTGPLAGPFELVHPLLRLPDLGDAVAALLADGVRVRTVVRPPVAAAVPPVPGPPRT